MYRTNLLLLQIGKNSRNRHVLKKCPKQTMKYLRLKVSDVTRETLIDVVFFTDESQDSCGDPGDGLDGAVRLGTVFTHGHEVNTKQP